MKKLILALILFTHLAFADLAVKETKTAALNFSKCVLPPLINTPRC